LKSITVTYLTQDIAEIFGNIVKSVYYMDKPVAKWQSEGRQGRGEGVLGIVM
jgi:hypothetical protein